tara:strand:- start:436 stop:906 length:471 start_codon:yes stop_codon:yes gene_type:complete
LNTFKHHINKEEKTIQEFNEATKDNIKVLKIMNNSFSTYDFTFEISEKLIYLTEVKTRTCSSTQYPDTILELGKLNRMKIKVQEAIMYAKKKNLSRTIRPGFLVKFTDGLYFFDLHTVNHTTSTKKCPKTSSSDGNNAYVDKTLVHFKIKDALKIK